MCDVDAVPGDITVCNVYAVPGDITVCNMYAVPGDITMCNVNTVFLWECKGGSRVLGKGGNKKSRGDCGCCGTIHRPKASGCDALGVAGVVVWRGVSPLQTLDVIW